MVVHVTLFLMCRVLVSLELSLNSLPIVEVASFFSLDFLGFFSGSESCQVGTHRTLYLFGDKISGFGGINKCIFM